MFFSLTNNFASSPFYFTLTATNILFSVYIKTCFLRRYEICTVKSKMRPVNSIYFMKQFENRACKNGFLNESVIFNFFECCHCSSDKCMHEDLSHQTSTTPDTAHRGTASLFSTYLFNHSSAEILLH